MAKSMVKVEKGEEYVPTVVEVFGAGGVQAFRRLVKAFSITRDKLKALETEMDGNSKLGLVGIKPQLVALMKTTVPNDDGYDGPPKLLIPGGKVRDEDTGATVALVPGTRKSLSKELLLANGVSLDVIERCMVESTYETLRITGI